MTDQGTIHAEFDGLAAGYMLYALEPSDEQRFREHAGQCLRCRRLMADFGLVTEALAQATPVARPSGQLGDRILAAALADDGWRRRLAGPRPPAPGRPIMGGGVDGHRPARADRIDGHRLTRADRPDARMDGHGHGHRRGGAPVVPLRRRSRPRRQLAAVAAVVALLAGGLWAGVSATGNGGPPPVLAACAHLRACSQVTLTATKTGRPAATVIVHDGLVSMESAGMTANPADEIYVLWQITGGHTPLPVGSFDIRAGSHGPLRIGGLAAPYTATWAFAVSLEHGRTIPVKPSRPIAFGQVT